MSRICHALLLAVAYFARINLSRELTQVPPCLISITSGQDRRYPIYVQERQLLRQLPSRELLLPPQNRVLLPIHLRHNRRFPIQTRPVHHLVQQRTHPRTTQGPDPGTIPKSDPCGLTNRLRFKLSNKRGTVQTRAAFFVVFVVESILARLRTKINSVSQQGLGALRVIRPLKATFNNSRNCTKTRSDYGRGGYAFARLATRQERGNLPVKPCEILTSLLG